MQCKEGMSTEEFERTNIVGRQVDGLTESGESKADFDDIVTIFDGRTNVLDEQERFVKARELQSREWYGQAEISIRKKRKNLGTNRNIVELVAGPRNLMREIIDHLELLAHRSSRKFECFVFVLRRLIHCSNWEDEPDEVGLCEGGQKFLVAKFPLLRRRIAPN
jgi:hypothetical protein